MFGTACAARLLNYSWQLTSYNWNSRVFFFFHLLAFQWQFLLKFSMPFKKCHYLPTASCSYLASFIMQAALVSVSRRDISLRILQAARAEATPSWPCGIERGAAVTFHWRAFLNREDLHYATHPTVKGSCLSRKILPPIQIWKSKMLIKMTVLMIFEN